jgi:restriction endonuclease S subunit
VNVTVERLRDLIIEARPGFACGERDTAGVLQLRIGAVTAAGTVDWTKAVRVPPPPDISRYVLSPGDVLFNNTNSQELVGRGSLVVDVPGTAAYSNHLTRLRCGTRLDPGYLVFWLNARWESGFFFQFAQRWIGQAAIQTGRLLDLGIPVPPIDEQRRIAARLRAQFHEVDGLEASATAQEDELAHLRTRVYEAAFPVTPLSVTTESASPDGWTWRSLGSLGRLESGHTPSRSRPDWWGGDIPWIALPDIRALDGRTTFETLEHTNPDGIAHSAARVLPAGTVVLSRTASVGFVTIMGRPMATSQDFVNWVCGPDLDPEFLMHLFIRSRERFRSLSAGAVHQTVYFPTAMALRVCVPSIDEQRRIAAHLRQQLAEIDRAKAALDAQRKAIDALPAALLREVFGPPGHVAGSSKP